MGLLPRGHGITVKDFRSEGTVWGGLHGEGIGELRTVIRQKDGKQGMELVTQPLIEQVNFGLDTSRGVTVSEECEHQFRMGEDERHNALSTNLANNRVHFYREQAGIVFQEKTIIGKCTAIPAVTVYLLFRARTLSGLEFHYPLLIHDGSRELAILDQPGHSTFGYCNRIPPYHKSMVDRLPIFQQRRYLTVDIPQLQSRHVVTLSGFR